MSVNTKMTAIADEIRTLSGTTGTMGLDAMVTNVGNANTEIDTQTELLAQIATALEGKGAGSGNSNVTIHTGTSAPTDDIGSDGDIYLVVSA